MEGKKSVADLRAELKFLREQSKEYAPVSKLKKADISEMIGMLKAKTMTTPAAGQMAGAGPARVNAKKTTAVDKSEVIKKPSLSLETSSNKKAPKTKKHDGYTEVEEDVKPKTRKPPTMEHKMKAEQVEKKKISMSERMAKLRAMKNNVSKEYNI